MFGDEAVPDIATRAAWDGTRLIQFRARKKLRKSPGPVETDPVQRDIIQNVYPGGREARR
jgi:hypothetical protein